MRRRRPSEKCRLRIFTIKNINNSIVYKSSIRHLDFSKYHTTIATMQVIWLPLILVILELAAIDTSVDGVVVGRTSTLLSRVKRGNFSTRYQYSDEKKKQQTIADTELAQSDSVCSFKECSCKDDRPVTTEEQSKRSNDVKPDAKSTNNEDDEQGTAPRRKTFQDYYQARKREDVLDYLKNYYLKSDR